MVNINVPILNPPYFQRPWLKLLIYVCMQCIIAIDVCFIVSFFLCLFLCFYVFVFFRLFDCFSVRFRQEMPK